MQERRKVDSEGTRENKEVHVAGPDIVAGVSQRQLSSERFFLAAFGGNVIG